MREEYAFSYEKSLFSMKPILKASEIDDSRPTVIRALSEDPVFISVLSGKINTVYDLDPFLGLIAKKKETLWRKKQYRIKRKISYPACCICTTMEKISESF